MATTQLTRSELRTNLLWRLLMVVPALAAMFFLPAGTFRYWEAWGFMAVMFIPMIFFALYLYRYHPALLERRMRMREDEPQQKLIIAGTTVVLLVAFILPGFDKRFGWSIVPLWLVIAADVVFLLSYLLFILTLRENEFASRIIEVEAKQQVITTGPYAVVRHPLYLAAILMYTVAPLALGSYWALLPAALLPVLLIGRILNEEKMLHQDLAGYTAYTQNVRYRLIPGVW